MVTSFYRMVVATLAVAPFFWRRWASRLAQERGWRAQWRIYGPALLAGVLSALDHATVSSALAWTAVFRNRRRGMDVSRFVILRLLVVVEGIFIRVSAKSVTTIPSLFDTHVGRIG